MEITQMHNLYWCIMYNNDDIMYNGVNNTTQQHKHLNIMT